MISSKCVARPREFRAFVESQKLRLQTPPLVVSPPGWPRRLSVAGIVLGLAAGSIARRGDQASCAAILPAGRLALTLRTEEPVDSGGGRTRATLPASGCRGSLAVAWPRTLETPAGTVLHIAHRELERLVLDRDTLHFKQSVSVRYAQLIYDGLWFSTLREALAAFVDSTEQNVNGEVRLRLYKGTADVVGRRSPNSLYRQDLATFGEGMAYDHADAGGFIRLFGLPERVRAITEEQLAAQHGEKPAEAPAAIHGTHH